MKNLFILNLFLVGIPITLGLLGFFDPVFPIYALLSTIFTGLFQFIIGFGMLKDEPKDKKLQWYAGLVGLFFLCWIGSNFIENGFLLMRYMSILPVFLAFFLTYIIYTKRNQ